MVGYYMKISSIFPFLKWFKDYKSEYFKLDIVSGLTVALVIIPQSMAYAQLAGLPVHYGLYASLLPPLIAALFGSSRQLATGPVAIVSLMTAATLEPLATAGSNEYVMYAIILALTVGIFQFLLGVIRLGLIINLLSHPVVNGFTNAGAIIIATSQLSKMFGVYVDNSPHHYETIYNVVISAIDYTHIPTLLIGLLSIGIMFFMKRYFPRLPNVLFAVVVTIFIAYFIGFENNKTTTISNIESKSAIIIINKFNSSIDKLNKLSEDLTLVNKDLDELKKNGSSQDQILKTQFIFSEIELKKNELKETITHYRRKIRDLKFHISNIGGIRKFLEVGNVHQNKQIDDGIWRIKVGYNKIDTESIRMIGGGAVVGQIPEGLPSIEVPKVNVSIFMHLLPSAIIISLLGFMEAIAIAKAMASKTGQRIDANQELIGQGLGNIIGSFAGSYPVSGSFSRSAVNLQSGAISGLSSTFTSIVVAATLLFFTPLLYFLPQSVLASIIIMAVIGLINVKGFIHAWKAKWYDGAISIVTFIVTLLSAPHLEQGIYLGVALSIGIFLYKNMRPKISSLSRYYDLSLRDSEFHELEECQYISLIRFGGQLIFANANYLEDEINKRMRKKKDLKYLIIVCNSINDIDASGEEALGLLVERVRSGGYTILFTGMNETMVSVLKRTYLYEKIGDDCIFPTMEKALSSILLKAHDGHFDEECPLLAMHHLLHFKKGK